MSSRNHQPNPQPCCSASLNRTWSTGNLSRRSFLTGTSATLAGVQTLKGLHWAGQAALPSPPPRRDLIVKPLLTYEIPRPRQGTSWRNWGELHSQEAVGQETERIRQELRTLHERADFPVRFLPISSVADVDQLKQVADLRAADTILLYAAGGWTGLMEAIAALRKDVVFFVRHNSGPVYLWYEIVHPRFLRAHSDHLVQEGIDFEDVVVDSTSEILWRLRALCGLKNTLGSRIIAVGGPAGWSRGGADAPILARQRWGLQIESLSYEELGRLLAEANRDSSAVELSRRRADDYLSERDVRLETSREFVERCFLLDQVFRSVMGNRECRALTINACMGTIMETAKTAACLTLSTLNDDGYLAFCESDFVTIPAGLLLASVSGRPPFLHNPTYPHDGMITLAHCTAPRRMDGETLEPARIVTHFESDFGAAPQVNFRKGQKVTIVDADFAAERWLGLSAEIIDSPDLPICRSQLNVRYACDSKTLAEEMRGFHWMLVYGDYLKEIGYALKRTPIQWKRMA